MMRRIWIGLLLAMVAASVGLAGQSQTPPIEKLYEWLTGAQGIKPMLPVTVGPSAGSTDVSAGITLQWASIGAVCYDVYLGTASSPPKVASNQANASYKPLAALPAGVKHYWKIVAKNGSNCGRTITGQTWSFTTATLGPPPPGDTTKPTVAIIAAPSLIAVSSPFSVTATCNDANGCASVYLRVDSAVLGSPDTTAPYTFDVPAGGIAIGTWQLTVVGVDAAGNSATSAPVTVQVTADQPPPPTPVDCVVSAWSAWTAIDATTEQRTRTITTQPANGGAPCPTLTETRPIVVPPPPPPPPPAAGMLTGADFRYKGIVRMPASGTDTTFAYGGMTGRQVNGKTRLFFYGSNLTGGHVFEIEEPGTGYTTDLATAPRATLVRNWGDIYDGLRKSWELSGAPRNIAILEGGLHWRPNPSCPGGVLYWTYYDNYNTSGNQDWSMGATCLDSPTVGAHTSVGPWRPHFRTIDGETRGTWRNVHLLEHPSGQMLTFGTTRSGVHSMSWGPAMYGGPWPTLTTPSGFTAPDWPMPDRYLEYAYMGETGAPGQANFFRWDGSVHGEIRSFQFFGTPYTYQYEPGPGAGLLQVNPVINGGVGSWGGGDGVGGALWLNLTHKRGVIYAVTLTIGPGTNCTTGAHNWYAHASNAWTCAHGCPAPAGNAITGDVSTYQIPVFLVFDPVRLESNKTGQTVDFRTRATEIVDLKARFNLRIAPWNMPGHANHIGLGYFDPARKYLFAHARAADNLRGSTLHETIIHVWEVLDVAPAASPVMLSWSMLAAMGLVGIRLRRIKD